MDFFTRGEFAPFFEVASGHATQLAWLLVACWLLVHARWIARRAKESPGEALTLLGLTAAALALRLALPWGPLSFADAERVDALWSPRPSPCASMCTVPVVASLAQRAGASVAAILRYAPPIFGALGVAATYLFARASGVRPPSAALAALVVLTWPSHLHFSTSLTFSVEGAALWSFAFAVALADRDRVPHRPALLAALAFLGTLARPEFRLMLVPLAGVVLAGRWRWRERVAFAALLALALVTYLPYLRPSGNIGNTDLGRRFVPVMLGNAAMSPVWWFYLGAAGVIAGLATSGRRLGGAATAMSFAVLMAVYIRYTSESNPRWGQWRYFTTLVPFVAVAVALGADLLSHPRLGRARHALLAPLFALAAYTLAANFEELRRAEDQAAEFAYLRETAGRVVARRPDVLLLSNGGRQGLAHVRIEMEPRMAIATVVGPLDLPTGCAAGAASAPRLRDLETVVAECPESISPERSVLYLGLARIEERVEAIERRFELIPLEERSLDVVVTSLVINRQASDGHSGLGDLEGLDNPDVTVRLGWYRLVPRRGPGR
ncbi:MAG: hypothetical protein R3A48_10200 [Polyangiales bacterium]